MNADHLPFLNLYYSLVSKHPLILSSDIFLEQPLLDMANDALLKNSEEEMVEALEALGNAGHLSSIKTIIKFLPGISPKAVDLPTRVVSSAVQSLRHLTVRDPHTVSQYLFSRRVVQ